MRLRVHTLLCLALLGYVACSSNGPSDGLALTFDFNQSTHGFVAGFADYPPADEPVYFLTADYRPLSEPLDTSRRGLFISGVNRSDDLFMFYKARLTGLRPDTSYHATFSVEFATQARRGCIGVGGSEDAVWVKAGANEAEPLGILEAGFLRMNIDKGNQSSGGTDAPLLGDIGNEQQCEEEPEWQLKTLSGGAVMVDADENGRVWVIFGTDSGFESLTALYYTSFSANFEPI